MSPLVDVSRPRRRATTARGVLVAAVALLLALSVAPRAGAHALLVKSAPASRALVGYPPERVQLWFNERLEPAFSEMSVWNASGSQMDNRDAAVGSDDAKRLSVTLKPLSAGPYTVRFRVLSVDGHVVESSFLFTVKPSPRKIAARTQERSASRRLRRRNRFMGEARRGPSRPPSTHVER